jgi:hypothetical protein
VDEKALLMRTLKLNLNTPLLTGTSLALVFFLFSPLRTARADFVGWYGAVLCEDREKYDCVTLGKQVVEKKVGTRVVRKLAEPTWEDAWPDPEERELVMKINRMNKNLRSGIRVAVPKEMRGRGLMSFSPFDKKITPPGEKLLIFDPSIYAWAAYDRDGKLLRWGPAVGGRGGFRTPVGEFRIYSKGDAACRSRVYPEGCHGRQCTPMPFCMTFERGNAFHAGDLPGRHESHGCVRLFYDDAEWLNREFVEYGTRVIVRPYF